MTVERVLRKACAVWQSGWDNILQDHLEGASAAPADPVTLIQTLGQLFDYLYDNRKARVARSTHDRDEYRLSLWRSELGNDRILTTIRPVEIADALARIGHSKSPSTANTSLGVLKTYLTWAANMGLIPNQSHRTVSRLKEPASQRHRREWWTAENVELALECAGQDYHQPTALLLVACGCLLGMRPEEIVMQRWQDIDLDAKDPPTAEPRPVCHVVGHSGWEPKDGEARDIPISKPMHAILLRCRKAEGFLVTNEPHRKGRPRDGEGWKHRYDTRKVWERVNARIVAAGGKRITRYGMRHSFASNFMIANVSDAKISRWLGHADTRMLHRHYGHLKSYDQDINAVQISAPPPTEKKKK